MSRAAIRPATAGDAARLSALAMRSKAHWGYDADFMEACRAELTFDREFVLSNTVFVLELEGEIVAFYALVRVSESETELGAIFVDPPHIGRGFGRALMNHARETARGLGAMEIVIQSDPNAAAFYEAAGAVRCGELESRSIPGRYLPLLRIEL